MKKFWLITLLLAVIALFGVSDRFVSSIWLSYHSFEGRCNDCHLVVPKPGEGPGTLMKNVTVLCTSCHAEIKNFSHPVDMAPSMPVPVNFPLDWKGTVTCVTCHPVHDYGHGEAHLRSAASGEGFCANCHGDIDSKMHAASIGTAHLSAFQADRFVRTQASVDELSLKCLSCHDSLVGRGVEVESKAATEGYHEANQIGLSHPIGVSYLEAKRLYFGAYRDIDKLPPEIHLFGGVIGCGTCHDPYSKRHYELVMSNEISALCLACHVK
ncbi:MAG: cytochrome c3 family protein [Deltaproteobacteria bacterium]|nr:cytochrome c3 family protein [Deltaproteobacteria bacterium]